MYIFTGALEKSEFLVAVLIKYINLVKTLNWSLVLIFNFSENPFVPDSPRYYSYESKVFLQESSPFDRLIKDNLPKIDATQYKLFLKLWKSNVGGIHTL